MDRAERYCPKHPDMQKTIACFEENCYRKDPSIANGIFCVKCHSDIHNKHNVKSFEDINAKRDFFQEFETKKQRLLDQKAESEKTANEQITEFKELIEASFNEIVKSLHAKKNELLDEVDKAEGRNDTVVRL